MRFVAVHLLVFGLWIVANLLGVPLPHFDPTYVGLAMETLQQQPATDETRTDVS